MYTVRKGDTLMFTGYTRPLYILPFDHRASYISGLFGWEEPLNVEQMVTVAKSKQVIYNGFQLAFWLTRNSVPPSCAMPRARDLSPLHPSRRVARKSSTSSMERTLLSTLKRSIRPSRKCLSAIIPGGMRPSTSARRAGSNDYPTIFTRHKRCSCSNCWYHLN